MAEKHTRLERTIRSSNRSLDQALPERASLAEKLWSEVEAQAKRFGGLLVIQSSRLLATPTKTFTIPLQARRAQAGSGGDKEARRRGRGNLHHRSVTDVVRYLFNVEKRERRESQNQHGNKGAFASTLRRAKRCLPRLSMLHRAQL